MPGPQVAPAKVGLLLDYPTGGAGPNNLVDALELTFSEAVESGQLDRPVELVTRQVLGLPNGEYHVVRDAFDELVAEGCVVLFGPISPRTSSRCATTSRTEPRSP